MTCYICRILALLTTASAVQSELLHVARRCLHSECRFEHRQVYPHFTKALRRLPTLARAGRVKARADRSFGEASHTWLRQR